MGIQINNVVLGGNLTRDVELRSTPNGTAVCEFSIANNHTYMSNNEKKEEVSFISVVVWGRMAENCGKYLAKGKGVIVEGRMKQQTWTTDDGQKRSKLKVIANRVTFTSAPSEAKPAKSAENDNTLDMNNIEEDITFD